MWRLLFTPPARGAFNMALDAALMDYARETGAWLLRVYSSSAPTLSLGRNQRARGGYDLARLAAQGIDVVRRPTGGRAILHDREITYAVAAPLADAGDLRESYARINRLLLAGLRALGVGAAEVVGDAARIGGAGTFAHREQPGLIPCFDHPSIGEIILDGRKLVGSAQWRCDGALLQHGSILVEDDQMQISSFLTGGVDGAAVIPPAATLREALGRSPSQAEVADALFDAVRESVDANTRVLDQPTPLLERAQKRVAHYLDDSWTWRR